MREKLKLLREDMHKHEGRYAIIFFACGFIFDILMTGRVDEGKVIIQQIAYLTIIALMIYGETREKLAPVDFPKPIAKIWAYREPVIHFFLGTLLNFTSIFYYKSASLSASFVFFLILIAVLAANEAHQLRKYGLVLRSVLFSLCLCSVMAILIPIALRSVTMFTFFLAALASALILTAFVSVTLRGVDKNNVIRKQIFIPSFSTLIVFTLLYVFNLIPPVPISVKFAGFYHDVKKENGEYVLYSETPSWMFWRRGDQNFVAQPGDKIYFFANIFSPTRFNDKIFIRWYYKDPRQGWMKADSIPMNITGGRDEGFRGYAFKSNYSAGHWRVQVESDDGREIARLPIDISLAETQTPRTFEIEKR